MKMKHIPLVMGLIALCLSSIAYGEAYPFTYKSIRAQGMGGAYVAVADDPSSLFLNPAGLSSLSESYIEVLGAHVELGRNSLQNVLSLYEASTKTGTADEKNSALVDALKDLTGKYSVAESYISFLSYYWHTKKQWGSLGIGFSPFSHSQILIHIRNKSNQTTRISIDSKDGGALGFGLHLSKVPGLSFGGTNRTFYHLKTDHIYGLSSFQDSTFRKTLQDDLTSGKIYTSFDLGLLYEYSLANWTFGVGTSMLNTYTTSNDLRVLNGGIHIKALWFGQLTTRISAEHKDILYAYTEDESFYKRLHGGGELGWETSWVELAIRSGLHQGYLSYGATADLRYLKIEYAHYTEEIGAYAGQVGSARDLVRVSMGF